MASSCQIELTEDIGDSEVATKPSQANCQPEAHSFCGNSTEQPQNGVCRTDVELKKEIQWLRSELEKSHQQITAMEEREKLLKERLSRQAIEQFDKFGSSKFEDLSLGENRPTQLVQRYGNLYSEGRVEALDALDQIPELSSFDDLKGKLLFSVIVLAFRSAQQTLFQIKSKIRHLLCISESSIGNSGANELIGNIDNGVSVYLRKTVDKYNISKNIEEVCRQLWTTLYDYPCLMTCKGLLTYIEECVRMAWALSVQRPPFVIVHDTWTFNVDIHSRFHLSDPDSKRVKAILWPTLFEGENGACAYKGVVIT